MQKLIYAFLIALNIIVTLNACGPQKPKMQGQSIDAALVPYLNEFQRMARVNGASVDDSHLTMSFSESMPPSQIENCPNCQVIAYCQPKLNGVDVVVKTSEWNQWPNSVRE